MKITEIEIHAGDVDHVYRTVGEISAKVEDASLSTSFRRQHVRSSRG
jgi:hypothetical protein